MVVGVKRGAFPICLAGRDAERAYSDQLQAVRDLQDRVRVDNLDSLKEALARAVELRRAVVSAQRAYELAAEAQHASKAAYEAAHRETDGVQRGRPFICDFGDQRMPDGSPIPVPDEAAVLALAEELLPARRLREEYAWWIDEQLRERQRQALEPAVRDVLEARVQELGGATARIG